LDWEQVPSFQSCFNKFLPSSSYLYNPGIMPIVPWAVGCLTRKNTLWCRAFFAECRAVFVDFTYF
jgi:hypothetical protein